MKSVRGYCVASLLVVAWMCPPAVAQGTAEKPTPKVGDKSEPIGTVVIKFGGVGHDSHPAGLGDVHGDVGSLQQTLGIVRVVGIHSEADARGADEGDLINRDGIAQRHE